MFSGSERIKSFLLQIKVKRKISSKVIQRLDSVLGSVISSNSVHVQSLVYVTICPLFWIVFDYTNALHVK